MRSLQAAFLILFAGQVFGGHNFLMPRATPFEANAVDKLGWTPMPTEAPDHQWLFKRDVSPTCGYIGFDIDDPLTCPSGNNCGFNTNLNAFGCCSSVVNDNSLTGCNFFTACLDLTADCNASCQSNTAIAQCATPSIPYCVHYTVYLGDNTFTNWGCADSPTEIAAYSTATTSGTVSSTPVVAVSSSVATSPTSSLTSTSRASISTSSVSSGQQPQQPAQTTSVTPSSASPFSHSQASASGGVPTVTVTTGAASSTKKQSSWIFLSILSLLYLAMPHLSC